MPESDSFERCILLLCDSLSSIQDGIGGANRSLALTLNRYKGIKVVTTIFSDMSSMSSVDLKEMQDNNITILTPGKTDDPKQLYKQVNESPLDVFPSLLEQVPHVTHIVGHSPITAEAALRLRTTTYPTAKVILFYHIKPDEVAWMGDDLAYNLPTDMEQVKLAEEADVVYTVSEKMHWFYTAKFRNRSEKEVDHRLFLPQCAAEVFDIPRQPSDATRPAKILALSSGNPIEGAWEGLDIAACAVDKAAKVVSDLALPVPELMVGGVRRENVDRVTKDLNGIIREDSVRSSLEIKSYESTQELFKDLETCSLCIVPSRSEPYGYRGLFALSAGIPTLIAENSCLAPMIRRLTNEPEHFLVPTTPTTSAWRQDASVWRDRIIQVLKHPEAAFKRAKQLSMAIRRDRPTKESHDNVISFTLGGIRLRHEVTTVHLHYSKDEEKELQLRRNFNEYLANIMQQCWRLKHHPLTREDDLYEATPGIPTPTKELMEKVTNHIEEWDRRIVGFEEETGSFIVYCPTPDALSDLWAMCDRINQILVATLLPSSNDTAVRLLHRFCLKRVLVRTIIKGPEFLKYKQELMSTRM